MGPTPESRDLLPFPPEIQLITLNLKGIHFFQPYKLNTTH